MMFGLGIPFFAYMVNGAVKDENGTMVFIYGFLMLACLGLVMAFPSEYVPSGCFIDWDGRSNSDFCN